MRSVARSLTTGVVLTCVAGTGCRDNNEDASDALALTKLVPTAVSGDGWKLFDRSLGSRYTPGREPVVVHLPAGAAVDAIKVIGGAPYRLDVTALDGASLGFETIDLAALEPGWHIVRSRDAIPRDAIELAFTPTGTGTGGVPEVELWTRSASGDGTLTLPAHEPDADLAPGDCASFTISATLPPSQLARAFLAFDSVGLARGFAVRWTLDNAVARDALWLDGDTGERHEREEIDPAALVLGANSVRFCLPSDATHGATISAVRLIGQLDRGVRLASVVTGVDGGERLLDGDVATTARLPASRRIELALDRWIAPDAVLLLGAAPGAVAVDCVQKSGRVALVATEEAIAGGTALAVDGGARACSAIGLTATRSVALGEAIVVGSGAAEPVDWPRLVVTSAAEHFGDVAWVAGFVARPTAMHGATRVAIGDAAAASATGWFGQAIRRTGDPAAPWQLALRATTPDGATLERSLALADARHPVGQTPPATASATASAPDAPPASTPHYGQTGDTAVVTAAPDAVTAIELGPRVHATVPAGALARPTAITVRHLGEADIPPLDPGMINVTAPRNHGYEFLPHGQKFAKAIELAVPFDAQLIPEDMSPDDVQTYYFDTREQRWAKLERRGVDAQQGVIRSATDHFTIMIDAVLAVPKNTAPLSFDPTALTSLAAALPGTNLDQVEAPAANSAGDARTQLPIRVPRGRGAYTPGLSIDYDSSAGNGWLGVGWALSLPRIEIDTRWGVPTYAAGEEPRYLLDGAELVPTLELEGPTCTTGGPGRRYHARIEGAFAHVLRCGTTADTFHWEVRDRDGTLFVYGASSPADPSNASVASYAAPHGIVRWHLAQVVDVHGNTTQLSYRVDDIAGSASAEPAREVYPATIQYTSHADKPEAPYTISFELDDGARPDRIVSGRAGFKMVTRHLLRAVHVAFRGTVIRDYVLTYAHGQFGKTVLAAITQYGVGGCTPLGGNAFAEPTCSGPAFPPHRFDYFHEDQSFDSPVTWQVHDDPAPEAAALGKGSTASLSANAGIAVGPPSAQGTFGANGSFGGREELVGIYDMDGDGLPDQVFDTAGGSYIDDIFGLADGSIAVLYNQSRAGLDPGASPLFAGTAAAITGLPALGAERETSWGLSAGFSSQVAHAGAGFSSSTSTARRLFTDLDGDGFIDLANPGSASRFGAPCAAGQCFTEGDFGAFSGIDPHDDPLLQSFEHDLHDRLPLADPVVQWVAPFSGTIVVSGTAQKTTAGGSDGVLVEAYHQDTLLDSVAVAPDNTAVIAFPAPTTLDVVAGEAIYLRVATGGDDGIAPDGTLHDLVDARLHVVYTHACTALGCADVPDPTAAREPTGAPVFAFDSHDDLRVAGMPVPLPLLARGTLELHAQLVKQPALADVRVCVQLFAAGNALVDKRLDRPCAAGDADVTNVSGTLTLPAEATSVQPLELAVPVASAGQLLMVRVESDLGFDPAAVALVPAAPGTPLAAYSEVCLPNLAGTGFDCSTDPTTLASVAVPLDHFGPFVAVRDEPPAVPFIAPDGGLLHVEPFLAPADPFVFAVRSDQHGVIYYLDCTATSCGTIDVPAFAVNAGESVSFELATSGGFSGSALQVYYDDPLATLLAPLATRALVPEPIASPFVGGYRGIRAAFWNEARPFAPATLLAELADPLALTQELAQEIATTIIVPNATFGDSPLIPSGAPAWIGPASDAFVSTSGLQASWLGLVQANGSAADRGGLFAANYARLSGTRSFFLSAGLVVVPGFSFDVSASASTTDTTTDVVDMNGDGVADAVTPHRAILGAPTAASGGAGTAGFDAGDALRHRSGHEYSVGFGGKAVMRRTRASGLTIDVDNPDGPDTGFLGLSAGLGLAIGRTQASQDLVDVNGDGLPDLVRRDGAAIKVRLNLGDRYGTEEPFGALQGQMLAAQDGFETSVESVPLLGSTGDALQHETTITTNESGGFDFVVVSCSHSSTHTSSRITRELADINGDGLPDLLYKTASDSDIRVQLNRGGDFGPVEHWSNPSPWPIDLSAQFGDVASELLGKLADLAVTGPDVLAGTGSQDSSSNGCSVDIPIIPDVVSIQAGVSLGKNKDTYELSLLDVDGDGTADHVLRKGRTGDPGTVYVKHNTVTGKANLLKVVHRPLGGTIELDYTRTDHSVDLPSSREVLTRVEVDDGADLGPSFASPNLVTTIGYEHGVFQRHEKEFLGFAKVTTTRADGVKIEDEYENQTYALHGRLVRETRRDSAGRMFHQHAITYATLPVLDAASTPIPTDPRCTSTLHPLLAREGVGPCTPAFVVEVQHDDIRTEGGLATKTRTTRDTSHDRFGNVLVSIDGGDAAIANDDLYAQAGYQNDTAHWILGRATSLEVRAGAAGGTVLRARTGEYDALGELVAVHVDTGAGIATTTIGYDAFGNQVHITTPPNEAGQNQTYDVTYDPDVATYPASTRDGFGFASTSQWDVRFGVATRQVDINGQPMTRTLDVFGRLATLSGPYDTSAPGLTIEYHPEETHPRAVTVTRASAPADFTGTVPAPTTTVLVSDGLGRTIELRKTAVIDSSSGPVAGMVTTELVARDNVGNVIRTQNPFFTAGASTSFVAPQVTDGTTIAFDALDRPIATTYADGASETTSFDVVPDADGVLLFRARVVDPNGHPRETFQDHVGRTRTYVEHPTAIASAITRYDYLATGELSHITDAEDNATSLAYDLRGLRTALSNADNGLIEDRYDLMGNRIAVIDPDHRALGNQVHYVFERDRLAAVDYPTKPDVAFTYGAPGAPNNAAGRVVAVSDETGSQQLAYGALGETRRIVRTVTTNTQTYTFDLRMTSDSLGRQLQVRYPDGELVTNTYDAAGMLARVAGAGSGWARTYASDIRYDVFGHRTRLTFGNGAVSTWAFDPKRVRLASTTTTLPSVGTIQDLRYSYDPASNPVEIDNNLPPLGGGSGTTPGRSTLALTYDGVDRLVRSVGFAELDAQKTTTYDEQTGYTLAHNIVHKQRVHTIAQSSGSTTQPGATNFSSDYSYDARPHLPKQVGAVALTYDASGNPLVRARIGTGALINLTWDDDNRLSDATSSTVNQHNSYDAVGTRVIRKSVQSETVFSSQYYDLENGTQGVKHVFAGDQRVASQLNKFVGGLDPVAPSKPGTAYFFHQDHLASTHVLTDDRGRVQESSEYFSDGETWIDRGPDKPVSGYLFSGKPFDPDTGFYDYGQRFYDPRMSLWLGNDPAFVKMPQQSVGEPLYLAPLAFARHSPLRMFDPDGRDPDDTQKAQQQKRKGTLVLFNEPGSVDKAPKGSKVKMKWSYQVGDGAKEYKTELDKALRKAGVVSGNDVDYDSMSAMSDLATKATDKYEKLVLIVHGAGDAPVIAVTSHPYDWTEVDDIAKILGPLGYSNITVLGCDAVGNKFVPNLAKKLPKGATVSGHKGQQFEITKHVERDKNDPSLGHVTSVKSNANLKTFKTSGP
jgi:RHS repeat-associated protein